MQKEVLRFALAKRQAVLESLFHRVTHPCAHPKSVQVDSSKSALYAFDLINAASNEEPGSPSFNAEPDWNQEGLTEHGTKLMISKLQEISSETHVFLSRGNPITCFHQLSTSDFLELFNENSYGARLIMGCTPFKSAFHSPYGPFNCRSDI